MERSSMHRGWAMGVCSPLHAIFGARWRSIALPAACRSGRCWPWPPSLNGCEGRHAGERQQSVAVDIPFQVVGQQIERRVDLRVVAKLRYFTAESGEPLNALAVVAHEAVDVAA